MDFSGDDFFRGCNTWLASGYMLCVSTLVTMDEFHIFSTLRRTRILKRSLSIRFEMEKCAQSMLLVAVLLCAVRTWKNWKYFHEFHVAELRDDGQVFSPPSAAFFGLLFGVEALCYRVMPSRVRNNNNNNNKAVYPKRALVCVTCGGTDLSGQPMVARASGAAQRRKLRRLRAALRHEQQSIAMALASALHHSADKMTRAQHNAPRGQRNAGTEYCELSDEDEVPARGSRPPCLGEPRGPQDRDQQRTAEQTAVYAPTVQILDPPVAQTVDQLADVLKQFDFQVPEQVIELPKTSPSSRWSMHRFVDSPSQPQTAEQLVEVPTIISFSSLQRIAEQNVDIPVVGVSGAGGGLSGFLPGQSYSFTAEQIVDNPVPRRGFDEGLQGFPPGQSSAASSEQTVHIPVPHGGRHDLHPPSGFFKSAGYGGSREFSHFSGYEKSAKIPRTQ